MKRTLFLLLAFAVGCGNVQTSDTSEGISMSKAADDEADIRKSVNARDFKGRVKDKEALVRALKHVADKRDREQFLGILDGTQVGMVYPVNPDFKKEIEQALGRGK